MIAIITLFSFIYTIPLFCEHTWEKDENGTIRTVQTPLRKEEVYSQVYRAWMYLFVRFVIPTISLIILNTLMIKEVIFFVFVYSLWIITLQIVLCESDSFFHQLPKPEYTISDFLSVFTFSIQTFLGLEFMQNEIVL